MKGCSRVVKTTERTRRTTARDFGTAMATMTMPTLALLSETRAIAKQDAGKSPSARP